MKNSNTLYNFSVNLTNSVRDGEIYWWQLASGPPGTPVFGEVGDPEQQVAIIRSWMNTSHTPVHSKPRQYLPYGCAHEQTANYTPHCWTILHSLGLIMCNFISVCAHSHCWGGHKTRDFIADAGSIALGCNFSALTIYASIKINLMRKSWWISCALWRSGANWEPQI